MKQHINEVQNQFDSAFGNKAHCSMEILNIQNSEVFYRMLKNKVK